MIFRRFLLDVNESNTFLVACEQTREALLVDLGSWTPDIPAFLHGNALRLTTVFITHDHYDHTDGLRAAIEDNDARVYSGKGCVGGLPGTRVGHGDTITVGSLTGSVVATPGHTPEGVSLVLPGMVFTGDALFAGSVGGTSSGGNAIRQLEGIREHVFNLPDHYEVHPGHGPSSTVAIERRFNPFFN